jgi:hypothetical protein
MCCKWPCLAVVVIATLLGFSVAQAQPPSGLSDLLNPSRDDLSLGPNDSSGPPSHDARQPVPSAADLKRANEGIRVIFEDDAAKARTAKDKTSLAGEIFDKRSSAGTPAEKYALLSVALNFAADGEDAALLLKIVDEMSREFTVDRVALVAARIGEVSGPVNPATWPAVSERLQSLAHDCVKRGRFDQAGQLINAVAALAKRAKDTKAGNAAAALRKTAAESKKAFEKAAELAAAADDPGADPKKVTEYGRFLCFNRGDWAKGLGYLARGDDAVLRDLARNESNARGVDQRLGVAEGWAAYAEKAPAADRQPARDHAVEILTALLPNLDGLAKIRVEKVIDDVLTASNSSGKDGGAWLVVFRSADPKIWNTDSSQSAQNYAVSLASVPATVKYLRIKRANGAFVIIPITKAMLDNYSRTGRYGFQGSKPSRYSATLLGIVDASADVRGKAGQVAVVEAAETLSGWGFGVVVNGGSLATCWAGKPMPAEPLEIAVLSRSLSADERKLLLE